MASTGTKKTRIVAAELPACPVETSLAVIGKKWKVLILRELRRGPLRFGELKANIDGVSQKMLTTSLREMADDGLVTRTAYPEVPPRVIYELTGLGESLPPVLDALAEWGEGYQALRAGRG